MALKKVPARFYLTASVGNPVCDWLMGLPLADRRHVGHDVWGGGVRPAGGDAFVPQPW
jgi:hypothetical protein